jgi:hypothetical protein
MTSKLASKKKYRYWLFGFCIEEKAQSILTSNGKRI